MNPKSTWLAFATLLLSLAGCSRHEHGTGSDAHVGPNGPEGAAEVKTAQITVWTERYEIFAEHRLVVAGKPTKFVTHVTELDTAEPRRAGAVKFRLRLGDEAPVEYTEKDPSRPGIYEVMLLFPKAGEWKVAVAVPGDGAESEITLPSVKVFGSDQETTRVTMPEPPEGIGFLKEQQWKVLAKTELVAKRKLVEHFRLPAIVQARPGSLAAVTPPVAGRLRPPPDNPMPMLGDKVVAGQTLVLVQPSFSDAAARFVEAESSVQKARISLDQARTAFERVQKLAQAQARTQRELQESEFALKAAQADFDAALALQAMYRQIGTNLMLGATAKAAASPSIELRSPIGGTIVAQLPAATGEFVSAEKSVFTVLDATTVFLEAHVPEANAGRIRADRGASYERSDRRGEFFPVVGVNQGRLVFLGLQVDPATRTVPLIYELKNPDLRLRVGQALHLYVETDRAEDALAVPDSAIVDEDGHTVVFVQISGETFQKREVKLGIRDGTWLQVLSGLSEGERVVTQGAYAIRLASVSTVIPAHGHVH
ncbi:MAG: efflux RND transporter periplasmic adaptor subunit [Verrucomicrobia bacterium]|nr:efflux RND transporter periplasmic adaptor subunit [Verrucomicrobiota bacterium]